MRSVWAFWEGVPYVLGGMLISLAIFINQRYGRRVTNPENSLYSMLTFDSQTKYRSSLVAGMLFIATFFSNIWGFEEIKEGHIHIKPFESPKGFFKGTPMIHLMVSGLLLGLGARLSGGGISKYAFYGVPKFNKSSIAALIVILGFAHIVATIRDVIPFANGLNVLKVVNEHFDFKLSSIIPLMILGLNIAMNYANSGVVADILGQFGIGSLLGFGMMIAGMTRRHQVLSFLSLKDWDPFMWYVFLGAILFNMFFLNFVRPIPTNQVEDPVPNVITLRLIIGSALFGTGWGISGLTPGSGLLVSPIYLPQVLLFFLPLVIVGQFSAKYVDRFIPGRPLIKAD